MYPSPVPECYGTGLAAGCWNTDACGIGDADAQLWWIRIQIQEQWNWLKITVTNKRDFQSFKNGFCTYVCMFYDILPKYKIFTLSKSNFLWRQSLTSIWIRILIRIALVLCFRIWIGICNEVKSWLWIRIWPMRIRNTESGFSKMLWSGCWGLSKITHRNNHRRVAGDVRTTINELKLNKLVNYCYHLIKLKKWIRT